MDNSDKFDWLDGCVNRAVDKKTPSNHGVKVNKRKILIMQIIACSLILIALIFTSVKLYIEKKEVGEYIELVENYYMVNDAAQEHDDTLLTGDMLSDETIESDKPIIDFKSLKRINDDIVGWIHIEDTEINYPVVQATDNNYYLYRSFSKQSSNLGSIFLDWELDMTDSDVVILYGHNMGKTRSGMFTELTKFDDKNYGKVSRKIITTSVDNIETSWELFAVVHADITTDVQSIYSVNNFVNESLYDDYVKLVKQNSLYEFDTELMYGQRILILSTCVGGVENKHMRRILFLAENLN